LWKLIKHTNAVRGHSLLYYINKRPTWCKLCSLIYFTAKSLYMFRVSQHPSSGVEWSLQNEHHPKPVTPNLQHTTNWEQEDRCGKSTTQSQAPDDGYINVRNMLNT